MSLLTGSELLEELSKASDTSADLSSILTSVLKNSLETKKGEKINMGNTIKVKHLSARDCTVSFRDVIIKFDRDGIGEVPALLKPEFEIEMSFRPGIYSFVEETAPALEIKEEVKTDLEDKTETTSLEDKIVVKGRKGKVINDG